ncbi:MAG: cytochrome c3 family protein [Desulfosalsimonas sp.]
MSKKSGVFLAGVFLTALIFNFAAVPAKTSEKEAKDTGAEMISLEGGALGKVGFPHLLHQQALGSCKECHELYPAENGAIITLQKTGEIKRQQVMNTRCIKCHVERKSVSKPSGSTKCARCHQRQAGA